MKKLGLFIFLFVMGFIPFCHASQDQKVYVEVEDILFDSTGIYIQNSNSMTPIARINHDEKGYWYEPKDEWSCPRCGTDNGGGKYGGEVCGSCGWPIYLRNQ